MYKPANSNQIITECLGNHKECKNCIYCDADTQIWAQLEKSFEQNSEFSSQLELYYKIKHKRNSYEQTIQGAELKLSESEVPFFLRRT